ncbi:MAG: 30S ribosomal protein S5 [Lentisphaeria bacterium]|jgi:small subunit ribosomal protein S5|nr:30S ribosomal protein S5 [Lentisphaeria bacterium]MBO7252734.1 30S ribosomal protein S5 [Oscillospiraceae bacterium]
MEKEEIKKDAAPAAVEEQAVVTYQAPESEEFGEVVLSINRCSKVVKGGRNFSFGALVVVGDHKGRVGYGYGKANEVSDAIRKGGEAAKKNMITVPRRGTTVPHSVIAKFSGSKVMIRPASEGTGLIAGTTLRSVLGLAGVVDVLTKSLGSSNPSNLVKAAFKAISQMNTKDQIQEKLGKN